MGIQSTVNLSRHQVVERISQICFLKATKNYLALEDACFEPDADIREFVNSQSPVDVDDCLDNWTNSMLEEVMDLPFFRFSMFDNYVIIS